MVDLDIRRSGSPRAAITHRVSVRRWAARKQAALAAYASQYTGGRSARLTRILISLPRSSACSCRAPTVAVPCPPAGGGRNELRRRGG